MATRNYKVLYVEDNAAHRRLLEHYLASMKDFQFTMTFAESEDAAVNVFEGGGVDLVLMDYHLEQGDGLGCLKRIRAKDEFVPIIALSGTATPEIAADLIEAGADDYLSKQDLNRDMLANRVADLLNRTLYLKERASSEVVGQAGEIETALMEVGTLLTADHGIQLATALDSLGVVVDQSNLSVTQLQRVFQAQCDRLQAANPSLPVPVERLMRPVMLELLWRQFGEGAEPAESDAKAGA